jgi:hypothetical protein
VAPPIVSAASRGVCGDRSKPGSRKRSRPSIVRSRRSRARVVPEKISTIPSRAKLGWAARKSVIASKEARTAAGHPLARR